MIPKCALLYAAFVAISSCQSRESELKIPIQETTKLPEKFREYQSTVILKEDNIRMIAARYALPSLPQMDSTILTSVYYPFTTTNGKFSKLHVRRGEQYNITLPGQDRVFVNAGSELLMNLQGGRKYYVLHGKTWFKTERDSAIILADSFLVNLQPHSKLNIDNYASDGDIIISLIAGSAKITHKDHSFPLLPEWEILLNRNPRPIPHIMTKMCTVDVTAWTVGGFRCWDVGFNSVMNEIGRLYNKDVFIDKMPGQLHGLSCDYRNCTIEEVVDLYNSRLKGVKLELSGDSLKVRSVRYKS